MATPLSFLVFSFFRAFVIAFVGQNPLAARGFHWDINDGTALADAYFVRGSFIDMLISCIGQIGLDRIRQSL